MPQAASSKSSALSDPVQRGRGGHCTARTWRWHASNRMEKKTSHALARSLAGVTTRPVPGEREPKALQQQKQRYGVMALDYEAQHLEPANTRLLAARCGSQSCSCKSWLYTEAREK